MWPFTRSQRADFPQEIEQLLRASDREGGDHDVAAAVEGFLDDTGKQRGIIGRDIVVAGAVGRFDNDIIGFIYVLRVADQRLVEVADIARKDDFFGDAVFGDPNFDRSGAEQMPHIDKAYPDASQSSAISLYSCS